MRGKHYNALRWAIDLAAGWRGSLIGYENDDESRRDEARRLAAFDAKIRAAREALKIFLLTPSEKTINQRKNKR